MSRQASRSSPSANDTRLVMAYRDAVTPRTSPTRSCWSPDTASAALSACVRVRVVSDLVRRLHQGKNGGLPC